MPQIIIVANCSHLKRAGSSQPICIRNIKEKKMADPVVSWIEAICEVPWTYPLTEIYRGQYWSVIREIEKVLAEKSFSRKLLVASAGLGLLGPSDRLPHYSATFQPRAEDDVLPTSLRTGLRRTGIRDWWKTINEALSPRKTYTSLGEAVDADTSVILVLLSTYYLEALKPEIAELQTQFPGMHFLIFAPAEDPAARGLDGVIPLNASLQRQLGGNRGTTAVRMALAYLKSERSLATISSQNCRQFLLSFQNSELKMEWPSRQVVSDLEVKMFIRSLKESRSTAYTPALRAFRTAGFACEMKRFKLLFNEELKHGQS